MKVGKGSYRQLYGYSWRGHPRTGKDTTKMMPGRLKQGASVPLPLGQCLLPVLSLLSVPLLLLPRLQLLEGRGAGAVSFASVLAPGTGPCLLDA